MKNMLNWRIFSLSFWVLLVVFSVAFMPDLGQLVRDKGEISLPENAQSLVAQNTIKEMSNETGDSYELIVVIDSKSDDALTENQLDEMEAIIDQLKENEEKLGITSLTTPLDGEEVAKQLVAESESAALIQMSIKESTGTIAEVRELLLPVIESETVDTYLTGGPLIAEDFMKTTEDGIKKTEAIAVVFIIVVLVLVFRSPIVPIISLLTVGVTYVVSMAIVTLSVEHLDFPFSNFTQVFLIVILFGVGTDYNILLYTRFKEELSKSDDVLVAIKNTIRSSGKTVVYSGIAVLIGFATLGLATFSLYQAMSTVAIGVAVLIVVLITLNPFFMALLGRNMFWPSKKFDGHGDSRLWKFLASQSVLRPFVSLIIAAVILTPFLLLYKGNVHYNDLLEVSDKYSSKQGIQIIQDKYPSGFSSPASLVIDSESPLDNQEMLKNLDEITDAIKKIDGVAEVMSPTRPTGEKIDDLYINDQSHTLGSGLGEANEGTRSIHEGLFEAEQQLLNNENGFESVQQLIDGTVEAKNGAIALQEAINQVNGGLVAGSEGVTELENGLSTLSENLSALSTATSNLLAGYSQIEGGLSGSSETFKSAVSTLTNHLQQLDVLQGSIEDFLAENPDIASDPRVAENSETIRSNASVVSDLTNGLTNASDELEQAMAAFRQANSSLSQIKESIDQMSAGADALTQGAQELKAGLAQGAEGTKIIGSEAGNLGAGLEEIQSGQEQLQTGLNSLQEQMVILQNGLSASTEGLDEISSGLDSAQNFLGEMSQSKATESFFVPEGVLNSEDFQQALDTYLSDNRKVARFIVILDVNPFSAEAMDIAREIQQVATSTVEGSELDQAAISVGGQSSMNADLREVASGDFLLTASIMLGGIGIFLILITRSLMLPVFIVGLLTLTYYTALSITEMISGVLFGLNELSWNVPFFGFILLVAIGVDYSIFLLMKYRESTGDSLSSIVEASLHIGSVVISAAVILGGTFAALYPSGVLTLMQVATLVIVGLILMSFLMLPSVLPALMSVAEKISNWASQGKRQNEE